MNDPIYNHALKYATEMTKIHLMEAYKKEFPHIFKYAHLESRPATSQDYYVPPSLAHQSLVVTRTYFDQFGCQRMSCLPFKENWEKCTEQDPPQWLLVGDRFELVCQPTCQEHTLHSEWTENQCFLSNPLKKMFASMPEKLFERASRHKYHGGLNVVNGTLKLNQRYCEAYGLDLVDEDCVGSGSQKAAEWFLGKTPIRAGKTAHIRTYQRAPPPLPTYVQYQPPKKRIKRSLDPVEDIPENLQVYRELALEVLTEVGEELTEHAVKTFLKQKAPKLILRSINNLSTKLVIKHALVVHSVKYLATWSVKALGKAFGVVTWVFALYEVTVGLLDMFDIYDYGQVLDKQTVRKIDQDLDLRYFGEGRIRPNLTPEYIWNNGILKEDESDRLEFMVAKVQEYLEAIYTVPAGEVKRAAAKANLKLFERKEEPTWDKSVFISVMCVVIMLVFLCLEYVHVWVNGLFFLKVFYKI